MTSPRPTRTRIRSRTYPCWRRSAIPTAVNPDRALRKIAVERGWPILTFANGVPLRERISGLRPPHATATLSVASASVAAVGAAWYALHRRRTRERATTSQISR